MDRLPEKETLKIEFKSDLKKLPDSELMDAVVAMSNTDGGQIYLGIEDNGTPTGVHEAHKDVTRLAALIANKTMPPVAVRVTTLYPSEDGLPDETGIQITRVEVPKSRAIIATRSGRIMRRRIKEDGTPECVPLYPYEIITRLSTIGQLDYSAFPVPDTGMDDFDPEELRRIREILKHSSGSDQTLLELPDNEMLAALQMTADVDGKRVPTVTGILLAGKRDVIKRIVPASSAIFQVLEGTEVRVNQDFSQSLLYTIEKMFEMLNPWNPEREVEDGLFRVSVPEFDHRAFREALVNAFGHRDYAALGAVRVLVNDEGLTISNPGGFIDGVTVDTLLDVEPRGRNQCLMNALKRVGLAERTGRGVDRIFEGSLRYGRPLPDYSASTSTTVSVYIARGAPDRLFMKMLNEEQGRMGKPLSLRALLVLNALKHQRRLKVTDLSEQLNITDAVTRSTIETLVEVGLVEARGSSTARTYILSGKVYEAIGKEIDFVRQSDIDKVRYPELIMKLARQKGGIIANRDVMELLHLTRKQAYRQLRSLVNSGDLKLVGEGSGAHYVVVSSAP